MMSIYYIIIGMSFIISSVVNKILKIKFRFYAKFNLHNNMTGNEIAQQMLQDNGIKNVNICIVEEFLQDHYNPLDRTINLSKDVFYQKNTTSAAIAAHECGHALQHYLGYKMLKIRNFLIPVINFSSRMTNICIISGMTTYYTSNSRNTILLQCGIGLFCLVVMFAMITLPIELNASNKALKWLKNSNIVSDQEYNYAKKSLMWASMTYIVSALSNFSQLIYFISFLINKIKEINYLNNKNQ
ncbi:zinc metallopeptidase [Blattabacterium cuenoti]|uniref:zinc metallopeptidase n=1 Tax=Blattabacterium cuenoti TaxID=1653831 RepID=UPI001EECC566|nr:zinc metallopeptidase [Blattabacterium cuenoti]